MVHPHDNAIPQFQTCAEFPHYAYWKNLQEAETFYRELAAQVGQSRFAQVIAIFGQARRQTCQPVGTGIGRLLDGKLIF